MPPIDNLVVDNHDNNDKNDEDDGRNDNKNVHRGSNEGYMLILNHHFQLSYLKQVKIPQYFLPLELTCTSYFVSYMTLTKIN